MRIMSYALVLKPGRRSDFLGQVRSLIGSLVTDETAKSVRQRASEEPFIQEDDAQGFGTPIVITIDIDTTAFNPGEGRMGPLCTVESLNLPTLPKPKVKARPF